MKWTHTCFLLAILSSANVQANIDQIKQQNALLVLQQQSANYFKQQAEQLHQSIHALCADKMRLAEAQKQWSATAIAWMYLQGQQRGPIDAIDRYWQVQYFPDKKNTTGRKLTHLTKTQSQWTISALSKQSVSVQGIGAIEWLLFDPQSWLLSESYDCQTSVNIAGLLSLNAQFIEQQWQNYQWPELSLTQWSATYLALINSQLDYTIKKMSLMLGKPGNPKPYFAEFWRSQTSLLSLHTNLKSIRSNYLAGGSGLDATLRDQGHRQLADKIVATLNHLIETWPESEQDKKLLTSRSGYQMLLSLNNQMGYLNHLFTEEAAIYLGVVVGFNSTDGD
ncbi:imelysin family protein [Vibrio agarivorans]|uniref:Imelysin family protein n=1 Tax=Vibrio agarivorans TaxID=153622 RepID=A0ABT7Y0C9_9VIBR|nr:imelysin family protein [Vibrio agarivorans]MDN2481456.1 imelysin family protein [Vibrio agarivorans]